MSYHKFGRNRQITIPSNGNCKNCRRSRLVNFQLRYRTAHNKPCMVLDKFKYCSRFFIVSNKFKSRFVRRQLLHFLFALQHKFCRDNYFQNKDDLCWRSCDTLKSINKLNNLLWACRHLLVHLHRSDFNPNSLELRFERVDPANLHDRDLPKRMSSQRMGSLLLKHRSRCGSNTDRYQCCHQLKQGDSDDSCKPRDLRFLHPSKKRRRLLCLVWIVQTGDRLRFWLLDLNITPLFCHSSFENGRR